MSRRLVSDRSGVLVIDKPCGLTSHDVVARVRRIMNTRRVGHAGTLDPMATGVLVVMVGQATKLAPFLTREDKGYAATLRLGISTDTLDADGTVTEQTPLPDWWGAARHTNDAIEGALDHERARTTQQPPLYSAIKVDGRAAYARARAGQTVELAQRPVQVHQLTVAGWRSDPAEIDLELRVGKGYYVRALARDVGVHLGVASHLTRLRRLSSGCFKLDAAAPLSAIDADPEAHLIDLVNAAAMALPTAVLTENGEIRTRHGAALTSDDFDRDPPEGTSAWLNGAGKLVAIGTQNDGEIRVVRGFSQ